MDKRKGFETRFIGGKIMKVKVGAIVPRLKLGDVRENRIEIQKMLEEAEKQKIEIVVFPELTFTGVSCGDMFKQEYLQEECKIELETLLEETKHLKLTYIIGMPYEEKGKLYNIAMVIQKGKIIKNVTKNNLTYLEKRWFHTSNIAEEFEINIHGITFIPAAIPAIVGGEKHNYAEKGTCVIASTGIGESTTDGIYTGESFILQNGKVIGKNTAFDWKSNMISEIIDTEKEDSIVPNIEEKERNEKYPFLTGEEETILQIQATSLARRLEDTKITKTMIGLSGGLDSTLAFLVAVEAYKLLKWDLQDIRCFTMPGYGTTSRTYQNACKLAKEYGTSLKEIDIKPICEEERNAIGLEPNDRSVTFENMQARQRTAILMNMANKENGLVLGTGNMSELALGWCTYNGDHMSMYAVNSGIPKTVVRNIVKVVAQKQTKEKQEILEDILETPISPELLPTKEDKIEQKTESIIGNYELHDFFLYHFIGEGKHPRKIEKMAKKIFKEDFMQEEISKTLQTFLGRFFSQQFKRNCMPDGPRIFSISLSPRGGWIMPSDMRGV